MSAPKLSEMKTYIKDNTANGFTRPSKSPAAAPVMFVPRPDGKLRLVVDYRGLNKVTVKNRFPLPLIPEMLDRLHLAKVFTKIDLRNAYHQVRVRVRVSEDPSQHVAHVRSILQVLRDNKLYAKVQKCEFNREQMTFVGYMVSPAGIGMDPEKIKSILERPVPTSVKEV